MELLGWTLCLLFAITILAASLSSYLKYKDGEDKTRKNLAIAGISISGVLFIVSLANFFITLINRLVNTRLVNLGVEPAMVHLTSMPSPPPAPAPASAPIENAVLVEQPAPNNQGRRYNVGRPVRN
jgi:putative exporter of polyketide antibiotics